MATHPRSSPASRLPAAEALRERIQHLLERSLFRQALAEVHRYADREDDPRSLRTLGWTVHHSAPHSKERSCVYSFARVLYRTAATCARDPLLRAEILADIGASYFEEGRLEDAADAFERSRSLAPRRPHAHLGLLAIACATRDLATIRRISKAFVADLPCWYANREVVALLATDPGFAALQGYPELFFECFGGYPDHLRALYDRYCLEALERALADVQFGEGSEPARGNRPPTTGARPAGSGSARAPRGCAAPRA